MSVTYTVIKQGFYGGTLYTPGGRRSTLTVDKKFKNCPSWLKLESDKMTPQQRAAATKKAKAEAEAEAGQPTTQDEVSFLSDTPVKNSADGEVVTL